MKKILYILFALCSPSGALAFDVAGRVVDVHDGDTLTVLVDRKEVKVRLEGIDAPELGQRYGNRAKRSLADICIGKHARVSEQNHGHHGRILGVVLCGDVEANSTQVLRGMAWVFDRYVADGSPLYRLQDDAKARQRGLWADRQPVAPWEWRARSHAKAIELKWHVAGLNGP